MGAISCSETSVSNYHTKPCNIPEERTSHQHSGGSLKFVFKSHKLFQSPGFDPNPFPCTWFSPDTLRLTYPTVPSCFVTLFIKKSSKVFRPASVVVLKSAALV
jgi:hypothetical protein